MSDKAVQMLVCIPQWIIRADAVLLFGLVIIVLVMTVALWKK